MTITSATYAELQAEILAQNDTLAWVMNAFGRMCLESPEIAANLIGQSIGQVSSGVMTYEAMQRQIRKDALAAMESREAGL